MAPLSGILRSNQGCGILTSHKSDIWPTNRTADATSSYQVPFAPIIIWKLCSENLYGRTNSPASSKSIDGKQSCYETCSVSMSSKWAWSFGWMAKRGTSRAARRHISGGGSTQREMPRLLSRRSMQKRGETMSSASATNGETVEEMMGISGFL